MYCNLARRITVSVVGLLMFFSFASASATTINTIYGNLTYTVSAASYACTGPAPNHLQSTYTRINFTNFSFIQGNVTTNLSGSTYQTTVPITGGTCPSADYYGSLTFTEPNFTIVFNTPETVTVTAQGTQGYVDPKFLVVGVTYAPPGNSSSTFVKYQTSSYFGVTNSLQNSFQYQQTDTVSITSSAGLPFVANGKITDKYSTTSSQTSVNSSSVTASVTTTTEEQTGGTGNAFAPVNNDYDIIWVWLNPAAIYTVYNGDPIPVWNGYGIDTTDENQMDIVPVALGYLNGDFGPVPADIQTSFNRSWASNQVFGSGQVAALTTADYAVIAAADPFSVSSYGNTYIGSAPPSGDTSDGRFSLTACNSQSNFNYLQADPSTTAGIFMCNLVNENLSTKASSITTSNSRTISTDVAFSGTGFLAKFSADLQVSNTITVQTQAQASITSSTTSTASLQVQGPACNNSVQGVGPCNPVYDVNGNQPTEYDVYQDNMYGTFMFAPVHYY